MSKSRLVEPGSLIADTQAFFDILNNQPDMMIVVVSVSYVDACLAALLQSFLLSSDATKKLLDPSSGALGSFSARSDAAYAMGLIPKALYQDLQELGKIRNKFAHHHLSLVFSDPSVAQLCQKLNYIGTIKNGDFDELVFPEERMPDLKNRFKFTIIFIKQFLIQATKNTKRIEKTY